MAKRTKKLSRSSLKLEALEQRQLLAGVVGGGTELTPGGAGVDNFIAHPNGNHYDQVLMTGEAVSVTNDAGTVTRVSFLDAEGDIVQAEFSGAGKLTISLADAKAGVAPEKYLQTGVTYMQGTATFTIEGSDATTNFSVFSVGSKTAVTQGLFDGEHTGGNHTADVARVTVVADPANPNGSIMGGIRAANAVFTAESGVVGITAANVQIQNVVRIGDIDAKGSATPALTFGSNSQFGSVDVAGGDLVQSNGKSINNSGSYGYSVGAIANTDSAGTAMPAKDLSQASFTDKNPIDQKTYDLTTSIDNITGTAGNDAINGSHTATTAVVSTLDKIDGGAGTDTLSISDSTGAATIGGLTVSNVESFQYTSTAGLGFANALDTKTWGLTNSTIVLQNIGTTGQSYTASKDTAINITSSATGLAGTTNDPDGPDNIAGNADDVPHVIATSGTWAITGGSTVTLNVNVAGTNQVGSGAVAVTGVEGTTSVNVTQTGKVGTGTYGAVNVTDWANGDNASKVGTIASVTLNGVGNESTISSNALTSLSLTKVNAELNLVDNLASHAEAANRTTLAVTVNESDAVLDDTKGTIKQIDFTATGKDSAVDIKNTTNVLTAITVAGDKKLDLTGIAFGDKMVSLTSTETASVKANVGAGVTVALAGGNDTIVIGAATKKAISLGAGDDYVQQVALKDGKTLDGGSIDGGAGTDTLSLTFADAKAATEGTTLADSISGIEKLELTGTTTAGHEINLHNLDDINQIVIAADATQAYTLKGLASGASVEFKVGQSAATTIDVPVAAVQNETLAVKITAGAATDINSLDTGAVMAVNVTSDDTASSPNGSVKHVVGFSSNSLKTITATGDASLNIDTTGTGVTTIDASGLSKGGLDVTTGILGSAATITGSAQNDTIVATAATKAVTVNTGNGVNAVTILNAQANTVTGGSGVDTIKLGAGNNTITAGGGADIVEIGLATTVGNNTVDLGDGNDKVTLGQAVGQTTITLGGGDDTVAFNAGSVPATGGYFVTVSGAGNSDVIDFSAVDDGVGGSAFDATKITLGQGIAFSDYLDAAANGDGSATSNVRWFQYGGDTYVVLDNSAAGTGFVQGTDMVVKLTGALDLSAGGTAAALVGGVLTI